MYSIASLRRMISKAGVDKAIEYLSSEGFPEEIKRGLPMVFIFGVPYRPYIESLVKVS